MSSRGDRPGVAIDTRGRAHAAFQVAVREALARTGMRQKELADAVGKSPVDISRYLSTAERLPREWLLVERILRCAGADPDEFARRHGSFWGLVEGPRPERTGGTPRFLVPTEIDANGAATPLVLDEPVQASAGRTTATPAAPRRPAVQSTKDTWVPPPPPPGRWTSKDSGPSFPIPQPSDHESGPTHLDAPFSRRPTVVPAPREPAGPERAPDIAGSQQAAVAAGEQRPPAATQRGRRAWLVGGALGVLVVAAGVVAAVVLTGQTPSPETAATSSPVGSWTATVGDVPSPGLALRAAPSRSAGTPVVGQLAAGSSVTVECGLTGDPVTSPAGQTSATWLRTSAGYVTSIYVDVAGPNPLPNCIAGQAPLSLP